MLIVYYSIYLISTIIIHVNILPSITKIVCCYIYLQNLMSQFVICALVICKNLLLLFLTFRFELVYILLYTDSVQKNIKMNNRIYLRKLIVFFSIALFLCVKSNVNCLNIFNPPSALVRY